MGRPTYYKTFEETDENIFQRKVLESLSEFFIIQEQVGGVHLTGKKLRIDAVMKPKVLDDWKNKDIAFGIEFKSPSKLDRLRGQMNFMKQCVDYSYTNFNTFGFIPVLSCPRFSTDETYSDQKSLTALRHFLNSFMVGELDYTYRGLSILFAEHHFIWENGHVNEGKRWSLKKNFGSK